MNDQDNSSTVDRNHAEPAAPSPPAKRGLLSSGLLPSIALVIALVALATSVASLWEFRQSASDLQLNVGTKLGEQGNLLKDTSIRTEQIVRDLRESQNRVALLEGKLAEFQGQRVALEEMYRELARAPDDWLLAEVEQTLNIASRELTLAGNVRAALIALQAADQRCHHQHMDAPLIHLPEPEYPEIPSGSGALSG